MMRIARCGSKLAAYALVATVFTTGSLPHVGLAQQPFPYVNNFTSTGLTHVTEAGVGTYNLDTDNGILNYSYPLEDEPVAGAFASVGSEQILGVTGNDFVMSTRFTINDILLEGVSLGTTIGFGAFSGSELLDSAVAPYYLADWRLGGNGSASQNGQLHILLLGQGSNVTVGTGNAGLAEIDQTYEMRLTGSYDAGALTLTLAVFDEMGDQLGSAASGTQATPLTGEYFGLRHRTAHATHFLDVDHEHFRLTAPGTGAPDGDFDGDGDVDGHDFLLWQRGDSPNAGSADDLSKWESSFGTASSSALAVAVPEPTSLALLALGCGWLVFRRRS